jgi:HD-GYP domain-containing protein (c-di-GMP phosphodiesterase class II)
MELPEAETKCPSAVAITYSALITHRPYQKAYHTLDALEVMKRDSHLFDPNILETFFEIIEAEQPQVGQGQINHCL